MSHRRKIGTLEIGTPCRVVGGYRVEGIVRDPDGCSLVDRHFVYSWPDEGRGYLSVSWPDGTVAPMHPLDRTRAIAASRKAIYALVDGS